VWSDLRFSDGETVVQGLGLALSDLGRVLWPADIKPRERLARVSTRERRKTLMQKFRQVVMILFAVFAVGVVVAESASAATTLLALWLWEGQTFTGDLPALAQGELLLQNTISGVKAMALCSGDIDGTVNGLNGADKLTQLLDLAGNAISGTPLTGAFISCEGQENCTTPEAWAVHLPWNTLAALIEGIAGVEFADFITNGGAGNPGWYVTCHNVPILGTVSDECTTEIGVTKLSNEAPNVDATFEEAFTVAAGLKLALCTASNAETGEVEGLITISHEGGGTLAVSE
jgi:hypothetical protein